MFSNIRKELIFLVLATPSVFPFSSTTQVFFRAAATASSTSINMSENEYYRADGVKIDFDPYAPGMAEKYGLPGLTDNDGFDPYSDTGMCMIVNVTFHFVS